MRKYVTVQGDMWDSIAQKQLGSASLKDLLMMANLQYREIYIFPSGVELVIPDVAEEPSTSSLPPWKRVMG